MIVKEATWKSDEEVKDTVNKLISEIEDQDLADVLRKIVFDYSEVDWDRVDDILTFSDYMIKRKKKI